MQMLERTPGLHQAAEKLPQDERAHEVLEEACFPQDERAHDVLVWTI